MTYLKQIAKKITRRVFWLAILYLLYVWRSKPIVFVRRHIEILDQFAFDATRLWISTWANSNSWTPPSPRSALRLWKLRRVLLKKMQTVAIKFSIPIRIVGGADLPRNVLGRYRDGFEKVIELRDTRQDDPWVLAHELGHYIAITFKNDTREAAADREARGLIDAAAGVEMLWLRPLVWARLPANGYLQVELTGGPATIALLVFSGQLFKLFGIAGVGGWMNSFAFGLTWLFVVFNMFKTEKRADPYSTNNFEKFHIAPPPSRDQRRLDKLVRLANDPAVSHGERHNALAAIHQLRQKSQRARG